MTESRLQKCIVTVYCVLMMFVLGASDALRGVFLPVFRDSFSLSQSQSSAIIMCSYIGSLLFLCIGGRLVDRISRKKFMYGVMLLWMGALTAYLLTANYYALLVFMIFSLGASAMLSTTVNLLTPLVYAAPAFFVNFFNFLQGAGISTAQNVGGRFASSLSAWKGANLILLACGCVGLVLLWFVKLPQPKPDAGSAGGYGAVIRNPACKYLFLLCGFYCITEHGLQNWLVTYGSDYLGYTVPQAARYLSFFFGGIMAGRLLFAPPGAEMRHYAQHAGVRGCRRGAVRFRHAAGAPGHAAAVRLGTGVLHSLAHHRAADRQILRPGACRHRHRLYHRFRHPV